jgi:hypothetical protein
MIYKAKTENNKKAGFIALISAILISAILLELSITSSEILFSTRSNSLQNEFKLESKELADSCIYIAIQKIYHDYSYTVPIDGEISQVENEYCTITEINYSPENTALHQKFATIKTKAEFKNTWGFGEAKILIHNPSYPQSSNIKRIEIIYWMNA